MRYDVLPSLKPTEQTTKLESQMLSYPVYLSVNYKQPTYLLTSIDLKRFFIFLFRRFITLYFKSIRKINIDKTKDVMNICLQIFVVIVLNCRYRP